MSKTFVYSKTKIIYFISFCCYTINIMELNQSTQNKILKIKELGVNNLCIISDFDDTLTKGIKPNGTRGSNSFSVYANNTELLGKEYAIETNKLFEKYYFLEQNPDISNNEKERYMIEWWEKEFYLYKKYNFSKDTINIIIDDHLMELKTQTNNFFNLTKSNNIPTIIFSAGIYNIIRGFLQKEKEDFNNIHVVANKFEFDKKNIFTKTTGDIIHSLNKNFIELSHLPIYEEIKLKKNCILLGDSISDTNMTKGANFDTILKIGFLNSTPKKPEYENRLKAHKEKFDIVLDGKEDFRIINSILEHIIN
jgi:HAD superfamily hydrolase (TIGR01544 family)